MNCLHGSANDHLREDEEQKNENEHKRILNISLNNFLKYSKKTKTKTSSKTKSKKNQIKATSYYSVD